MGLYLDIPQGRSRRAVSEIGNQSEEQAMSTDTTDAIYKNGLAANIISLRHTLARAMIDATTACKDLENSQYRAAVGAVIPIDQALKDARALLDTIFILNRNLN
jgi:hypothetical protein